MRVSVGGGLLSWKEPEDLGGGEVSVPLSKITTIKVTYGKQIVLRVYVGDLLVAALPDVPIVDVAILKSCLGGVK